MSQKVKVDMREKSDIEILQDILDFIQMAIRDLDDENYNRCSFNLGLAFSKAFFKKEEIERKHGQENSQDTTGK